MKSTHALKNGLIGGKTLFHFLQQLSEKVLATLFQSMHGSFVEVGLLVLATEEFTDKLSSKVCHSQGKSVPLLVKNS
ncbi:hypothetical protein MTO96_026366 [Rhipicephalus appendiculatus]